MKKSKTTPQGLSEIQVKEVLDQLLRVAFRDHSREMEGHLRDIDTRLKKLEKKR
jgi:hypothetical protein|tara:strand:- start:3040 stop:3201 length:162 start_codon:yes stop_codon:yes gene_type:complete